MLILGVVSFVTMDVEKAPAVTNFVRRISEKTLWLISFAGRCLGTIGGAGTFRHKTSKGEFWPPVMVAVVLSVPS